MGNKEGRDFIFDESKNLYLPKSLSHKRSKQEYGNFSSLDERPIEIKNYGDSFYPERFASFEDGSLWKIFAFLFNACVGVISLIILITYTRAAKQQVILTREANLLASQALNGSQASLERTLQEMNGQTQAINEQTGAVNKQTAQTAAITAESTQAQVKLSLPFITPVSTEIVFLPDRNPESKKFVMIRQQWDDTGQSRAEHVNIDWGWSRNRDTSGIAYQNAVRNYAINEHSGINDWYKVPKDEVYRLVGDTTLYLFAIVSYDDVLPIVESHKTHAHRTTFCYEIRRFNDHGPSGTSIQSTACKPN